MVPSVLIRLLVRSGVGGVVSYCLCDRLVLCLCV